MARWAFWLRWMVQLDVEDKELRDYEKEQKNLSIVNDYAY